MNVRIQRRLLRHAYYFILHQSNVVGGNYAVNPQQNYRLNVPQFRERYIQGKTDRALGHTPAQAAEYAQSIRDRLKKEVKTNHTFTDNQSDTWSSEREMKGANLFGNELSASYLKGFNGVQWPMYLL